MPNQRAPQIKRTTITIDERLYEWAMRQAREQGINDFSTFVRTIVASERHRRQLEQDREK